MKTFRGRVAAVTGAGSGIGRALARELAARGAHLALSDINEATLAETVMLCEAAGAAAKITSQRVGEPPHAELGGVVRGLPGHADQPEHA